MKDYNHDWKWDNGPIGRLMKVSYLTLRNEVEEHLKPLGITHTQWSALGILSHFPGITSSELEPILMIERPSVTSLINGMVKRGWVERKAHPKDARSKQLFLTEEGEELAQKTQPLAQLVEDRVKDGFTQEEFETLKRLLVKMVETFE